MKNYHSFEIPLVHNNTAYLLKKCGYNVFTVLQIHTGTGEKYHYNLGDYAVLETQHKTDMLMFVPDIWAAYAFIRKNYPNYDMSVYRKLVNDANREQTKYVFDIDDLNDELVSLEYCETYEDAWQKGLNLILTHIVEKKEKKDE